MTMKFGAKAIIVTGVLLVLFAGCDEPQQAGAESAEDGATEEYHSPFYIAGEGDLYFERITFTDVGLNAPDPGPAEPLVMEAIAESLVQQLERREALDFTGRVDYDKNLEDPAAHMHCDRQHLYVALWRGWEPDRWGYSLWSGCHEQQKFAWEEVLDPHPDHPDVVTWVEPLVDSIVDSIEEADEEECFSAKC